MGLGGLAAARARGKIGGAVKTITDATIREITKRNKAGEAIQPLAKEYGISRQAYYKRARELRDRQSVKEGDPK